MPKRLIVNADDFGMSPGINRGVLRAHAEGIVTSASLMVLRPAAAEAVAAAREHPSLSLGLHLDLGEWERVEGEWRATYETPEADAPAEIGRQLGRFLELAGRPPTHLDSHQHVHRDEPVRSAVLAAAAGRPVRLLGPVTYRGDFYGQDGDGRPLPAAITAEALAAFVRALPDGVTELGCHPAEEVDVATSYAAERIAELRALCDPLVRAAVEQAGVELWSFADVG